MIAVFCLTFSLFFNMLGPTGIGLFDVNPMPVDPEIDMEMATQLTEASGYGETTPIGGAGTFWQLLLKVLEVVLGAVYIVPILSIIGVPLVISGPINVVIILIYLIDLLLLLRGLSQ